MNRDEILNAVQADKNEMGEFEKTISQKAVIYGAVFGVFIWCLMMIVELLIFKKMDFGKPTIIFAICGYSNIYEGLKSRIHKKIVSGTIECIIVVISIMLYIGALFI